MSRSDGQRSLVPNGERAAAPFLKWAGGKGQLLAQLEPLLPAAFGRYIEPFVGGGAMFFHLHNLGRLAGGAVLSDLNAELMNCYRVVQDEAALPELISALRKHARHASSAEYFYRVRAWDRKPDFLEQRSPVARAARTIFLNKTCYNGLYRLNSKGQFNVPYGKWAKPPRLFDEAKLKACHRALQGVELRCEGFEACLDWAKEGDFVYLDPPYHPLSRTASFTTYTGSEFRERHQRRLAEVFRVLAERGALLMLSNSATPLVRRLYPAFRMETVQARRAINCQGGGRAGVEEVVVVSYPPAGAGGFPVAAGARHGCG